MNTEMSDAAVQEILDEQEEKEEEEEVAVAAAPKKPARKAKPVAAKGGAFIDANEKKASKSVRNKSLEKEEKKAQKKEAAERAKRIKEGKAKLEKDLAEQKARYAKEKEETMATATAKKKATTTSDRRKPGERRGGKPRGKNGNAHAGYAYGKGVGDDSAFVSMMAKYIKKTDGGSWSTVIKAMRKDGHAAGQKRARRLFPQAVKAAGKSNGNGKNGGKK